MIKAIQFEWDPAKARTNLRKHRVSFEEAATVFYDDRAILIADPDHSNVEDRFVLLGMSSTMARLLVVCHSYRAHERRIRLFSARKATNSESLQYR